MEIRDKLQGLNVELIYVNTQNSDCDKSHRNLMRGNIRYIIKEGVQLSNGYVPFVGHCASIISIKRSDNNDVIYENLVSHEAYLKKSNGILSEEEQNLIKKQGKFTD